MQSNGVNPQRVVTLTCGAQKVGLHEKKRHESLARAIANLKGSAFGGEYQQEREGNFYVVPHDTIVGLDVAASFGIRSVNEVFGGIVPHWFLATKAVIHNCVNAEAARPEGWSDEFANSTSEIVLPGYTAFRPADAHEAGMRLLQSSVVRVKDGFASGGKSQKVVQCPRELETAIAQIRFSASFPWAAILEVNLEQVITYSIGQVILDGIIVSYWGTQHMTHDNFGQPTYGGSELWLIRGGFDQAAEIAPTPAAKCAVQSAALFDAAVPMFYPNVIASRRNYDVAQGRTADGVDRIGVLDQSWRVGGASGIEIAAVAMFKTNPDVRVIHGSCLNVYGDETTTPPNAIVHYQGVAEELGPMVSYTLIEDCW